MIYEQPFFTTFVTTFSPIFTLFFLLSPSIALVFVSIPHFLCKILVGTKVVTYIDVQITQGNNSDDKREGRGDLTRKRSRTKGKRKIQACRRLAYFKR